MAMMFSLKFWPILLTLYKINSVSPVSSISTCLLDLICQCSWNVRFGFRADQVILDKFMVFCFVVLLKFMRRYFFLYTYLVFFAIIMVDCCIYCRTRAGSIWLIWTICCPSRGPATSCRPSCLHIRWQSIVACIFFLNHDNCCIVPIGGLLHFVFVVFATEWLLLHVILLCDCVMPMVDCCV